MISPFLITSPSLSIASSSVCLSPTGKIAIANYIHSKIPFSLTSKWCFTQAEEGIKAKEKWSPSWISSIKSCWIRAKICESIVWVFIEML